MIDLLLKINLKDIYDGIKYTLLALLIWEIVIHIKNKYFSFQPKIKVEFTRMGTSTKNKTPEEKPWNCRLNISLINISSFMAKKIEFKKINLKLNKNLNTITYIKPLETKQINARYSTKVDGDFKGHDWPQEFKNISFLVTYKNKYNKTFYTKFKFNYKELSKQKGYVGINKYFKSSVLLMIDNLLFDK